jgi:DNA-binding transcriptional ArsR family regulator
MIHPKRRRASTPEPPADPATAARNRTFAALADPVRRRMLETLADGKPRTASQLAISALRTLDATLKQLVWLREAGFLVISIDPTDSRRQLYALAAAILVARTERGLEMDFGCCVVRL